MNMALDCQVPHLYSLFLVFYCQAISPIQGEEVSKSSVYPFPGLLCSWRAARKSCLIQWLHISAYTAIQQKSFPTQTFSPLQNGGILSVLHLSQQLLFQVSHPQGCEGWRDEDGGSCMCYCDLLLHFPSTARCAMEIRVWKCQKNQTCLVPPLIFPLFQLFRIIWCCMWWQYIFILGFHRNVLNVCKKTISHQEKTGNFRIFLQVENLEKMQIGILSQSNVMFVRHMVSSWFYICKQVISCNNISWVFFWKCQKVSTVSDFVFLKMKIFAVVEISSSDILAMEIPCYWQSLPCLKVVIWPPDPEQFLYLRLS